MRAKENLRSALESMLARLGDIEAALGPEEWRSLRSELRELLDELQRYSTSEQWKAAWEALVSLASRYPGLLKIGDLQGGLESFPVMRGAEPYRGRLDAQRGARTVKELLDSLQEGVGKPALLATYPEVSAPAEVQVATPFAIEVVARGQPSSYVLAPVLVDHPEDDGPVDFEVEMVLPEQGGLSQKTSVKQPLRVPEGLDSVTLKFWLVAEREGIFDLTVRFHYRGVERLSIPVRVRAAKTLQNAVKEESPLTETVYGSVGVGHQRFAGFSLTVDERLKDGGLQSIRLTLARERRKPIKTQCELRADASTMLAKLCRELHESTGGYLALRDMKATSPLAKDTKAQARTIEDIGAKVSSTLLEGELMSTLLAAERGTELHIVSDDAWFPWELLWVGGGKGFFLGEHFAVTRGLRVAASWPVLKGGRAVLVAPEKSGLPLDAERGVLRTVTSEPLEELKTVGDVQERLRTGERLAIMHFVCHGNVDPKREDPLEGALELDGGALRPLHVQPRNSEDSLQGSLVFINACHAGAPTDGLSGHGGWARAFFESGAGAVVVPSWAVYTHTASRFAARFYEEIAKGTPLGEAGRRARVAAAEEGNPDHLAYAVYAAPGARFERSAS